MEDIKQRSEEFLKAQEDFRENAFEIIKQMLGWCKQIPGSKQLVDEIPHSIFFFGEINKPKFEPKDIIGDDDILNKLKEKYPGPLQFYKSQLPRRSPFSCVLDMIVKQKGGNKMEEIKQSLQKLVNSLKVGFLVSSTLCVTTYTTEGVTDGVTNRYYGVSMSTTGPNAGKIAIAASCLSEWEEYVSGAVMTYYPEKNNQAYAKKSYFDGTFKLPNEVPCQAFNIKNKTYLAPCRSCGNLFGLPTHETKEWPYGNCAEVESVSKLLKNEERVKRESKPTSPTFTAENRKRAEESVRSVLKQVLKMVSFKWVGEKFYQPQG